MTTPQDPRDDQPWHYQAMPPPPAPGGFLPASPGPRPKEVDISFWLWVTSFVLGLLGLLYFVVEFDTIRAAALEDVRAQALREGGAFDEQQLESIANVALVMVALVLVLMSAAQLLLAFAMRKGRNWARIVLAVIGGLSVLGGLFSMGDDAGQGLLSVLGLLVVLGALVTMFLPAANPWFQRRPSH